MKLLLKKFLFALLIHLDDGDITSLPICRINFAGNKKIIYF